MRSLGTSLDSYLKLLSRGWRSRIGGLVCVRVRSVEVDVIVVVITTWADMNVQS
jgi:hypothetical protein